MGFIVRRMAFQAVGEMAFQAVSEADLGLGWNADSRSAPDGLKAILRTKDN